MTPVPTLETERLRLVAWRQDHLAPLAAFYAGDPGAAFVGGPLSERDTWRRLAAFAGHWQLRGFGLWALEQKADSRWLGWCGLWFPVGFPETELGYTLIAQARGQGYITEAAIAARRYAFETVGLKTLVSYIAPDNAPSQRVAQRLGAAPDGAAEIQGKTAVIWRHPAPSNRDDPHNHPPETKTCP